MDEVTTGVIALLTAVIGSLVVLLRRNKNNRHGNNPPQWHEVLQRLDKLESKIEALVNEVVGLGKAVANLQGRAER